MKIAGTLPTPTSVPAPAPGEQLKTAEEMAKAVAGPEEVAEAAAAGIMGRMVEDGVEEEV